MNNTTHTYGKYTDMDTEEFSKEADVTLPAISEQDFNNLMLSAPEKCEHCDGSEFVPATVPTLGGGFRLPMCKNCGRVSRPTNWPSSKKEGSKVSATTFDSKYPCLNEKCNSSNYKLTGFTEAMTHYVKNFGNPAPVFTCTKCGEDGVVGNDINRLRGMGQELHDQWKGANMSVEKSAATNHKESIKTSAPTIWEDAYLQDHTKKELNSLLKSYEEAEWQCPRCNERNPVWSSSTVIKGWNDFGTEYIVNKECGGEIDPCPKCEGSARQDGVDCPKCSGTGTYRNKRCEECQGQGEPFCNKCDGHGKQWCGFKRKNRDEYLVKAPKGKRASVKTALENPFDGYGRPFSEDPLNPNVDPAYYGDNPASDTKPYAGPNSYSINTTAPYMPPNSGMENPSQNVGPYSPPGYEEEAAELGLAGEEGIQTTAARSYDAWNNETEWFDGTSESIYRRIASAREIQKAADKVTANLIEEQVKVLEKVANEFEDSSLAEYMTSVPGGTVAMEYDNLMDGGLVDVASFISTEAHKYITEVNTYDWNKFASDAPRMWVTAKAQNNPGVLLHEGATREAAIDYVKAKTMVLMDPVLRADIIDNFVSDVEVERRSYVSASETKAEAEAERRAEYERQQRARVAAELSELEYADDDIFPGQTVVGTNDPFDFGDDDGSAMYAEAKKVVEAHANRNWESFCTEGARDWFYSNDSGKNSMYRHADTTRHAAKQYVEEETTLVKDAAMKSEIRRAFLASVDFLREEWLEKQASIEEPEEDIDVLSQYYDDETLW